MNARTYNFDDKAEWGDGPWMSEPDKLVWVDDATNLDCMIVRNHVGSLCGYVGVPEGHPWHGQEYDHIDAEVHGGLTFSALCQEGKTEDEQAICHTVQPGRPDNVWWLGFDTAHAFDLSPAMEARMRGVGLPERPSGDVYRRVDYVQAETTSLAQQAAHAS